MAGLVLALRDALGLLLVAALVVSIAGLLWRGALAAYPVMVALSHDGRTYLALVVALTLLVALKPGGYKHGA